MLQPRRESNPKTTRSGPTTTKNHHDDSCRNATQHQTKTEDKQRGEVLKKTTSIKTGRKTILFQAYARQRWQQQLRQTGYCGCVRKILRGSLHVNDEEARTTNTSTRIVRITTRHCEAIHDARTQRRHQPTDKRKRGRHERTQRRDDQRHNQRKKHVRRLYNKAIKPHEEPPLNWRETTVKVKYTSWSPASPSNHRHICSILILYKLISQLLFKRLQPTHKTTSKPLPRQVSDQATPRQTTFARSSNSDREPPSGTKRCGSLPSTSRKHSTRMGGLEGTRRRGNHTYNYSQSSTTKNEHQCAQTSEANTHTSSEEPSMGDPLNTLLFNSLPQ